MAACLFFPDCVPDLIGLYVLDTMMETPVQCNSVESSTQTVLPDRKSETVRHKYKNVKTTKRESQLLNKLKMAKIIIIICVAEISPL